MTKERLKENLNIILDCLKMVKEYHGMQQAGQHDLAWEEVMKKAEGIYKKYNTEFARKLTLLIVCELEEQSKE